MADGGLRMALADPSDAKSFEPWTDATNRGFHGGTLSPERQAEYREADAARRNTGVWDDSNANVLEPVGTANSWPSRLAVPGGRTIQGWAVSSVTVASTHHGRGIARALLEAELRTASALGVPMAMLTVSESSLYQRYGFAPAAMAADYEFDVRRVTWSGPTPGGRIEFISIAEFADVLATMHERLVPTIPGMVDIWPLRVAQLAGTSADDESRTKKLRAVRYLDEQGETRGIANYRIGGGDHDFTSHTLSVEHLAAETTDADAALWRFLLQVPLVETVTAGLRRVDEPVHWMITDWRAATVKTWEHQYLRVLDVAACFEGRGYLTDGEVVFDVDDPYGFAAGRWKLTVQDGVGRIQMLASNDDTPALRLGVPELSAIYLGGVAATTLAAAGRITESTPGAAVLADGILRSPVTPYLSIWY